MPKDDQNSADPRDDAILRAAMQVFARYGLRRTTMADIADAAGLSRPALYLRFAGKDEIFRALVRRHFASVDATLALVLRQGTPAEATLLAAFHAIDGEAAEAMLNSPHADELLSPLVSSARTEVEDGLSRICGQLARWIGAEVDAGRLTLDGLATSPAEMAEMMLAAKTGLKAGSPGFAAYRAGVARLAAIMARAMRP
jgi:AcrR family transcriptional regulator